MSIEAEKKLTDNQVKTIETLSQEAADLQEKFEVLKKEYEMKKSELKTFVESAHITAIDIEGVQVTASYRNTFKSYDDEAAVIDLIPKKLRAKCKSLDRKKINDLIKAGELTNAIKDHEVSTQSVSITIKRVE